MSYFFYLKKKKKNERTKRVKELNLFMTSVLKRFYRIPHLFFKKWKMKLMRKWVMKKENHRN